MSRAVSQAVTMTDVAHAAGVSRSTVSRVLTGDYPVSVENQRRVRDAVQRLGYRRCAAARALVQGRSRLIGVVVGSAHQHGWCERLAAIDACASEDGFTIALAIMRSAEPSAVEEAVNRILEQGVDAVLIVARRAEAVSAADHVPSHVPAGILSEGTAAGSGALGIPLRVSRAEGETGSVQETVRLAYETLRTMASASTA